VKKTLVSMLGAINILVNHLTISVAAEGEYTEEQYKQLRRKIDRYLLPLMWLCYGIQQTDKTALGTQATFGLREDTGLRGQQYSWLTTIFCTVVV
jgi:ACS family allantoate permease-like MFS transporter